MSKRSEKLEPKELAPEIRDASEFPSRNPHPVARVRADGNVLCANAAASAVLERLKSGEGKPAPAAWVEWAARALRTRERVDAEFEHDGRTLALTVVPADDYAIFYGHDISDLKRAQTAL